MACCSSQAVTSSLPWSKSLRYLITLRSKRLERSLLPILVLTFAASAEITRRAAEASSDSWSQFRGNPRLTGVSSTPLPEELKLLWTYEAGESVESSAAIVDGVVFVGSMPGELVALNLDDGTPLWKYRVGEEGIGESSPAVDDGVVYFGDLAGIVHAVSVEKGERLWTFATEGEIKSSPVVVDGKVLVGSYDEHLYCLSARNGESALEIAGRRLLAWYACGERGDRLRHRM